MSEAVVPRSFSEAAAALSGAVAQERPVRIVGAGTKLGWGGATPPRALRLLTTQLSRVVVDDDREAATLNAGTPLVRVQALLARSGLMLAADPQLGLGQRPAATVGGVVATADTGPLSHRYGALREQIVGITAALADGRLVRTGPRGDAPQNGNDAPQDGYDIARLLTGSFGTLGLILAVDVRVWPLPGTRATALGTSTDPVRLRDGAVALAQAYPNLEALDVAWRGGRGGLLAQVAGAEAAQRAASVAASMRAHGLQDTAVHTDDAGLWARQRAGQRSFARAVLRVHARRDELDAVLRQADAAQATVVGRAALGVCYLTLDVNRIDGVRAGLPSGTGTTVLDLPASARGAVEPWGAPAGPELELMRELKHRFDPAGVCNPGVFVGRI